MKLIKSKFLPILVIFIAVLIYYLPILIRPALVLERGNDLENFFWPIYHYTKAHIFTDRVLPLWNNLFLAGTPLLPDPQAPIFYPLNIFALFLPLNIFFVFSFILHTFIGAMGTYLCSKKIFKFSLKTSLLLSLLYLSTPKLAGYLEAGHLGLVFSLAWIPFALFATFKLRQTPKIIFSILLALSLSLVYFCHLPTFLVISLAVGIFSLKKKSIIYFILAAVIAFGLTAVSVLPQLEWQKVSTRYLLLKDKDVYPKWASVFEPIEITVVPWMRGISNFQKIDSEKWVALGIFPTILAVLGFLKLKGKYKLPVIFAIGIICLIVLNNASPIYPILLKQNWYLLLRVSTRFWILIILLAIYLIGLALEKSKSKLFTLVSILAIVESTALGWSYLQKPVSKNENSAPREIYEYLTKDKSIFRVFCLTRCLSQKTASIFNLQLLDGYSTVQQNNFYKESWQLTGTYWDYYTLSIPPMGTFKEKINPDPKSLGEYNVKYIISPYALINPNFFLTTKIENYFIYENKLLQPRTSDPISIYTPNFIRVNTENNITGQTILSEVYSPGWKAFLNGKQKVEILETPTALQAVDINANTKFVDFKYSPDSFKIGKYLSLATIILILIYGIFKKYIR